MTGSAIILIALAIWVIYSSWRFYRYVRWTDTPVSTPDYGAMRKREAELLHIQEVLEEARDQGKLAATAVEDYNRFFEREMGEMKKEMPDEPALRGKERESRTYRKAKNTELE